VTLVRVFIRVIYPSHLSGSKSQPPGHIQAAAGGVLRGPEPLRRRLIIKMMITVTINLITMIIMSPAGGGGWSPPRPGAAPLPPPAPRPDEPRRLPRTLYQITIMKIIIIIIITITIIKQNDKP
jgi:hypothetical protein